MIELIVTVIAFGFIIFFVKQFLFDLIDDESNKKVDEEAIKKEIEKNTADRKYLESLIEKAISKVTSRRKK